MLNWLVALAWVARAAETALHLGEVDDLLAIPAPGLLPREAPLLAVVVPACNEEAAIGATLRSLLGQRGLPIEIIAVDDRSTDRTGAIMDEVAAEVRAGREADGRVSLSVLHIRELPAGWMGKQHALARGAEQTTAPYLLFTDGDIFYAPDALRLAMSYVLAEQADHFVLLPTPILKSFAEHMMISAMQVYSAWAVRLWKIKDPRSRDRLGVGAFNLLRREAYEAIGEFAALRMEVLEDVRLGVEIKRRGLRQRVAFGAGLVTLHWATGLGGVVHNVTKNFFAAFRFRVYLLLSGCAALAMIGIYPALCLLGPWPMQLASCTALLAMAAFYVIFRRPGGSAPGYALLLPFATVILIYAMLRSAWITIVGGAVVWRGTSYPLAQLRRDAGPLR